MSQDAPDGAWRLAWRGQVLRWTFGTTAFFGYLTSVLNTVTGGGLGLVSGWLWFFSSLWVLQLLYLRVRPRLSDRDASGLLAFSCVALTADALLQPVGFWQLTTIGCLQSASVIAALCLDRRHCVVPVTTAVAGIVLVVHQFSADLLRWGFSSLTVVFVSLVMALVVVTLMERLEGLRASAERAAVTDPLTGLRNRAGLRAAGAGLVTEAAARGRSVGVLLLDVDDFKRVNDVHGHATGDAVLVAVAGALRCALRSDGVIARTGGEEVLVVTAVDADDVAAVAAVGERLRRAVADIDEVGLPRTTCSVGTAVAAPLDVQRAAAGGEHPVQDLLERLSTLADAAMYDAKRAGRNRVCASASAR